MTKRELSDYLTKATEFLAQKDYPNALKEYKGALRHEPENMEALKGAGLCCFNMKDNIGGQKYFQKAVEIDKNDATALYYLASLSILNEKIDDAINYSNKVLELRPDFLMHIKFFLQYI